MAAVMISDLTGETVVKKPGEATGASPLVLDGLTKCEVSVLDSLGSAKIDNCRDCVITVGPTENCVFLQDCKGCVFHIVSQQVRVKSCVDCEFFLWVPTEQVRQLTVAF